MLLALNDAHDYPLFDAESSSEAGYLARCLIDRRLVAQSGQRVQVTADGWDQLEPSHGGGISGTCFVAMSFGQELDPAFEDGIKPAVEADCGFRVIQLSREEHTENINDKILSEIRRAQFLIADVTGHRNGVYFEAGFGSGLGKLDALGRIEAARDFWRTFLQEALHRIRSQAVEHERLSARARGDVKAVRSATRQLLAVLQRLGLPRAEAVN